MQKKLSIILLFILTVAVLAVGCKRGTHRTANPSDYFKTPFQDESQFIVYTVVSDLAEQIYYAKYHKLPPAGTFYVEVDETPDSPFETPVYDLQIDLDSQHKGIKCRLNVNGPIWSPEVYDGLATQLGRAVGLPASSADESKDTSMLVKLTDGLATTIEKENQDLSTELDGDFSNPNLHEESAVLLGAFMLREHSGDFYDIRTPLCRMTAHLAMARYLGGTDFAGINGQMANALLLTLMNNEASALEALKGIKTNDAAVIPWVMALRARNSGDYRPLDSTDGLSQIECVEWFKAHEGAGNSDLAWGNLSDTQKKAVDFVRVANEAGFSVQEGHELLEVTLPVEFQEIASVYELSQGKKTTKSDMIDALNQMPERCISTGVDGRTSAHVIGWGLWAGFLQRHLCQAMEKDFNFLERQWGVEDEAKSFSTNMESFAGLRLYPFVRRFNAVTVDDYHKSVDDGFKVTVATPQLVSPWCWNNLCWPMGNESYQPSSNPHVNEWHKHNPPPGTAYNVAPRFYHPSLTDRGDSDALLDKLHGIAPYDWDIAYYIYKHRYHEKPNYAQAEQLFAGVTAYKAGAMQYVAYSVQDQPERFEFLLSQAAKLNPYEYYNLADFFADRKEDDKAAGYLENGMTNDPDSVLAANRSQWLVEYYLRKGRTNDASRTADFAGEVYSYDGLMAKAVFLERTGDYNGAYQWYANIADRYDAATPLVDYCVRYEYKTGDTKFNVLLQAQSGKVFPDGIESAKLNDFSSAPADGALVEGENDLIQAAGMKKGDVVVALDGVRVHKFVQYNFERLTSVDPVLDLIVWDGSQYREIKANPPHHRFGVPFGDYPPKK